MNCPTDDMLRAYLDAELDALEISELKNHLQACLACEARFQALSASAVRVASSSPFSMRLPSAVEGNPQIALARFKAKSAPERGAFFLLRARIFAAGATLGLLLSLQPCLLSL